VGRSSSREPEAVYDRLRGQDSFIGRIRDRGDEGEAWLRALPTLIAECEARWNIRIGEAFPELSYNFVVPATRADGTDTVLKLGNCNEARAEEVDALRIFDGRGACRLLELDEARGAMLLERLMPGTELRTLTDDEQATRIAADVMRRLWQPVPAEHRLQTLADRGCDFERLRSDFGGGTGPYPARLVEQAEYVFKQFPEGVEPMVLHGDCHHYNILLTRDRPGSSAGEEWVTIDPHGLAGDPGYEVGCFIYNPGGHLDPLEQPDPKRYIARRVAVLAESLGWHRERVRGWCLAQSVLSSWWTYEYHRRYDPDTITVAQYLDELAG